MYQPRSLKKSKLDNFRLEPASVLQMAEIKSAPELRFKAREVNMPRRRNGWERVYPPEAGIVKSSWREWVKFRSQAQQTRPPGTFQ